MKYLVWSDHVILKILVTKLYNLHIEEQAKCCGGVLLAQPRPRRLLLQHSIYTEIIPYRNPISPAKVRERTDRDGARRRRDHRPRQRQQRQRQPSGTGKRRECIKAAELMAGVATASTMAAVTMAALTAWVGGRACSSSDGSGRGDGGSSRQWR
eukprot:6204638-Pleurochrysis_carterae.AAC.2